MESLIETRLDKRIDFELLKSNTCHRLKELGDIDFIIKTLEDDRIRKYYKKNGIPKACIFLLCLITSAERTIYHSVHNTMIYVI
ncbi:MAG: hypothetical protein U0L18_04795 [Acutalibacteraceae bacterium]|nr:hypothetical protein [Acutalibacteraceae bacterium]